MVTRVCNIFVTLLLVALFGHLVYMFLPQMTGKLHIANDYVEIPEKTLLNGSYIDNREYIQQMRESANKATEDLLFVSKNLQEFSWQSQCGWFMHHHNALLGSINESVLGKDKSLINFQYGMMNVVGLGHLLSVTGGVTFHNYFRILYSFYPIYFLLFLGLVFLLTRSIYWVLLAAIPSFICLNLLGFIHINLAPGFNPIRQLGYLFVVAAMYLSFSRKSLMCFVALLLSSVFAILNNTEFGVFAVFALTVTFVLKTLTERRKPTNVETITFFLICLSAVLFCILKPGNTLSGEYYLKGISGPLMGGLKLSVILCVIGLFYVFLIKALETRHPLRYVATFLFFYSQAVLFYYVWNSAPNHFFSIATPIILVALVFIKICIDETGMKRHQQPFLVILSLALIFPFYVSSVGYYKEKHQYQQIFNNHKVYSWDFLRAKFRSTMDPIPFSESLGLIDRFSDIENRHIYIISKFDNLLPFLAGKYSAMPFSELAISLLTDKEVRIATETLLRHKPRFLFVDTDINSAFEDDPVYSFLLDDFGLKHKVDMLNQLKVVFRSVKREYRPVAQGTLITVYQRVDFN